jgi:plastocyanin
MEKQIIRTDIFFLQLVLSLLLIIGLVFVFPIYLYAADNVVTVEIYKYKFTPQNIKIKPGTTIRWVNKEKRQYHSVWFEQLKEVEPDYIFPDETYERTFNKTGAFPYRCGPHPEMLGSVKVEG